MLYAAKCYWPGVTETDLEAVTEHDASTGLASGGHTVTYLGSLPFTADDPGPVPVPEPLPGGRHPSQRPARYPP